MKCFKSCLVLAFALSLLVTACGGSGGSGGSGGPISAENGATTTGLVFTDAPVAGASVNLYALNADGTTGALLGTAVTGTNGSYSATLRPAPTTPILAVASGGSYRCVLSGSIETLSSSDILQAVLPFGTTDATISPLTTMAAGRASALAAGGTPLDTAITAANTGVAHQYNLPDILSIAPPDANSTSVIATATWDSVNYFMVLAGLADEANTLNVRTIDLTKALASDISDGGLDGEKSSASIQMTTKSAGTLTLSASAGTSGLQSGINHFSQSASNNTNISEFTIIPTPELIAMSPSNFVPIATLPAWIAGKSGSASIPGITGSSSASCSLTSGSLPAWLSLNNCTLSGTAPLLPAGVASNISAPFTITVSDPANPQNSHAVTLMATVVEPAPVIIPVGATCTVNRPCSKVIAQVTGGITPYSYRQGSLAYGPLPWGMSVDLFGAGGDAVIKGTPNLTGTYTFQVCATDFAHFGVCTMTTVDVVEAQCTYDMTPTSSSPDANGGNGSITVTASGTCAWTATSNANWITITSGNHGSGNGTVNYTVAANTGSGQRTGTITVGGQAFTVTQAGAGVTGVWVGTLNMPGAPYPGCTAQTVSFSLDLNEDVNRSVTGSTSNGRAITSGSRNGGSVTVTLNTMFGSRGPYTWTWNGTNQITGSMAYYCYDLGSGALQFEGTETFTVTRN